jgi:FixJ family two-component response regulator
MKCLLLCDDHARVRAELEAAVPGVEVVEADDPREVMASLEDGDTDLLLLNTAEASPEMLTACRAASDAAIITVGPDELAGVRTMKDGADDFLDWPASRQTIRAVVGCSLAHRRIRRTAARVSEKLSLLTTMGAR